MHMSIHGTFLNSRFLSGFPVKRWRSFDRRACVAVRTGTNSSRKAALAWNPGPRCIVEAGVFDVFGFVYFKHGYLIFWGEVHALRDKRLDFRVVVWNLTKKTELLLRCKFINKCVQICTHARIVVRKFKISLIEQASNHWHAWSYIRQCIICCRLMGLPSSVLQVLARFLGAEQYHSIPLIWEQPEKLYAFVNFPDVFSKFQIGFVNIRMWNY